MGGNKMEVFFGKQAEQVITSHKELMKLHYKALACHCECLGMNAENSLAVCRDEVPPYPAKDYSIVMEKWGLIDKEGNPVI